MKMNHVYVNHLQNPNLAQRAELPRTRTGTYAEHTNTNLSRNDSTNEDYAELSDFGNITNLHQQQILNKGKILSLHNSVIAFLN